MYTYIFICLSDGVPPALYHRDAGIRVLGSRATYSTPNPIHPLIAPIITFLPLLCPM